MTTLIPPVDYVYMRRKPGVFNSGSGGWHILKPGREQTFICGNMASTLYEWERGTLSQVKAKELCALCWPYEAKDKNAQLELLP